ncbi:hypothetical protein NCC49_001232 [Naganishia albida]|nr:hypothetical protein NCC49_001232 [Naganishia albida]
MPSHKTVQLNDGVTVPLQGYGTHQPKGLADQAERIKMALEAGIRHIDCAERYHTEEGVGQALKELGFDKEKRDQIFVTTKCKHESIGEEISGDQAIQMIGLVFPVESDPRQALDASLKLLGLEYVDLYLIHNPSFVEEMGLAQGWQEMEQLQAEGKTRSIGVSNYRIADLEETLKTTKIIPAVNQVEIHPYVIDKAQPLIDYCHSKAFVSPPSTVSHRSRTSQEVLSTRLSKTSRSRLAPQRIKSC